LSLFQGLFLSFSYFFAKPNTWSKNLVEQGRNKTNKAVTNRFSVHKHTANKRNDKKAPHNTIIQIKYELKDKHGSPHPKKPIGNQSRKHRLFYFSSQQQNKIIKKHQKNSAQKRGKKILKLPNNHFHRICVSGKAGEYGFPLFRFL
jgi:hypothetical protein